MTGNNNLSPSQAAASTAPLDLAHCTVENIFSASDSALRIAIVTNDERANVESLDNKQLILRALTLQESLEANPAITPSKAMQYMLQASVEEVTKASIEDTAKFKQTLLAAHQFDTSLPAVPDSDDDKSLLLTALTWKVILHQKLEAKNAAREVLDAPPPPAPETPSNELTLAHDTEGLELGPPFKKQKGVYVGGVQIVDQQGNDTANRPLKLGPYPGKDHAIASLSVQTLMGSKILRSLLQKGTNLETAVANMRWCRGVHGEFMAAEAEAHNLARMIHIAHLSYQTMEKALEQSPWMEIGLRRLYALIHVENAVITKSASRAAA